MNQPRRLAKGGRINRSRPLSFTFNGRRYSGFEGDTLASALLANNVRVVSRSFKFHRPRGILSAGLEEPNALLAVDTGNGLIPLVQATTQPLVDGLVAHSQNCFPSLDFDIGRVFDFTRPLWPAGFYNKVFKWPGWHTFENMTRRIAGLGELPDGDDASTYRHENAHCDVLVVGAGPYGLRAALDAARNDKQVFIAELDTVPGGSLLFNRCEIDGRHSDDWLAKILEELRAHDNVTLLTRATVAGYYDHNVLTVHERSASSGPDSTETFWKIRAGHVVIATGAIEQPLMFGNNDLPGVMLATAMHTYAGRFGVACGENIVGVVNNDNGWQALLALSEAGTRVAAIADARVDIPSSLLQRAEACNIMVYPGAIPLTAKGRKAVRALVIRDSDGKPVKIDCDAIAMSGGLNPTLHLYSQAGGNLKYDQARACFIPDECRQSLEVIGAASGDFSGGSEYTIATRDCGPGNTNRQWVDYLHDVTVSDIELAVRENFVSVEHLKRYTTVGMSVDQGKTSNLNALSLLARITGRDPGAVGVTTFRPQFKPVTMGAIAGNRHGDLFAPLRRLPAHSWHQAQGAEFEDYGGCQRPAFYGAQREKSIEQEMVAVRNAAGLFDGSPLGKIEVKGPDAAEFLNRIYVNQVLSLAVGRVRYGLMLNENGVIIDDGVFVRMADDHFLINTTSAGSHHIAQWLQEWHQCEWPDLELVMMPVTSQWAVFAVAGPRAREILSRIPGMIDLESEKFPHMHFAQSQFPDGRPYRIQRVSYTGELSYELSVPADQASEFIDTLSEIGGSFGMRPIGIEALMGLRTEKGYLHVGADTDGTTNPLDVGFEPIISKKTTDFVGKRSLSRANDLRDDRRQLVGLKPENPDDRVAAGAHIVVTENNALRSEGFVTSACFSPTLGESVALALLEGGFDRKGQKITIYNQGATFDARVVDTCFYDPAGEKIHA